MGTWLTPRNMSHPTCYHAKFGGSRSNLMSLGRGPKNYVPCPWYECDWFPRNMFLSISYSAKFGRCRSNHMGIHGFPKNVGDASALPLGMVACLTPTKIPLPHVQPCQIWSFSVKWHEHTYSNFPGKTGASCPAFQGQSTYTDPLATYNFLLVINSNHERILYHFQHKWQFQLKISNFSHSMYLMPH